MEKADIELAEDNAIVGNAVRLIKDAKLLVDHNRNASAFALSVIALEEFGKVILRRWTADTTRPPPGKRRNPHLAKQEAVSCLLLGRFVVVELSDTISSHEGDGDALRELVARAMYGSEAGQFSKHVAIGAVDKMKQLALYRDQNPILTDFKPEDFKGTDPQEMFEMCRTVADAIWNARMMHVGRALYDTHTKYPRT